MARSFDKKARNTKKRKQKPVMVVAGEGRNVTKLQYILSFRTQHGKYAIHPHKTGHHTDPIGILKSIEKYWRDNQLSKELGDKAFILLDIDCDPGRAGKINKAIQRAEYAEFILSNPCFEIWFLFHYEQTTHFFLNGEELLQRLKKYIPDYSKNSDISTTLRPLLDTACKNTEFVRRYHEKMGRLWPSDECNPMTDMTKIIMELIL